MTNRKLGLLLLLLVVLFVSSCDLMNTAIGMIPSFDGDLPNVFNGNFAYFEVPPEDMSGSTHLYTSNYKFSAKDHTFEYDGEGNVPLESGTYSYTYSSYDIISASGILELVFLEQTESKPPEESIDSGDNGNTETKTPGEEEQSANSKDSEQVENQTGDGGQYPEQTESPTENTQQPNVKYKQRYTFRYYADALEGPNRLELSDGKTYYYYR